MTSDERIEYWRRGQLEQNFGDFIAAYLEEHALITPFIEASQYRLVGSTIDSTIINLDRQMRAPGPLAPLIFWCGGARSSAPMNPTLLEDCEFFGVRGPLTRDLLNLPHDTALGDPGLLIPLLCDAAPASGEPICIPHINDPKESEELERLSGGARVVRPVVSSLEELESLFKSISAADFVLCGSLHAAIIACAFERPFAFWDTGHIDIPFKWHDFAASIGVPALFCDNLETGREIYEEMRGIIAKPKLTPLLGCCPFAVRPAVWAAALASDAGLSSEESARLKAIGAACLGSDPTWVAGVRARQAAAREELRFMRPIFTPSETLAPAVVASVAQTIHDVANNFAAEAARARFSFESSATLRFGVGEAGAAMLQQGWTRPNHEGPWAIEPNAVILLPQHTGWWRGTGFSLTGYFFAPQKAPFFGRRSLSIWMNEIPVSEVTVTAPIGIDTVYSTIEWRISDHLAAHTGDAYLRFSSDLLISPKELGDGDDVRTIAFAPLTLLRLPA